MLKKIKNSIGKNCRFVLDYYQFKNFLNKQRLNLKKNNNNAYDICIVLQPWLGTVVAWYANVMAIILAQKEKKVCVLVDDITFGDDKFFFNLQSFFIKKIAHFNNAIDIFILSEFTQNDFKTIDEALIDKIIDLNSIHYTKGETNINQRELYKKTIKPQYENIYMQYNSFISQIKFDKILIPGGFYGSSYIGVTISKSRSIQVITYDADENYMLFSIDGIAAHLSDFSISFNNIFSKDEDRIFAIEKGMNKILERMQNKDEMYKLFNKNVICDIELLNEGYYLMLLNSVWDATTLGMHTVYDKMVDWIIDTIRWILEHTNKTIVIRQHPAERNKLAKGNDDYEKIIQNIFGNEVRIVLVAPEDDINTYALIKKSSTVVGFCSTSVVESVALGKPAIIVSSTYYANLGIVYNANSKEEYYSYLYKSSKNELEVTQEMKDRACVCNYITQSCNWYKTEFTPNRNNFLKWSKRSLEEIEKDYLPLQAILENKPVSLLKHKENYFAH